MKSQIEKETLQLKPGPLPSDLKERLRSEPSMDHVPLEIPIPIGVQAPSRNKRGLVVTWLALGGLAAAVCVMFNLVGFPTRGLETNPATEGIQPDGTSNPLVSLIQKNEILLSSKTLAIQDFDGQLWEIVQEEWIGNTIATCETVPVVLNAKEIRREIVFRPVRFQ